MGQYNGILPLLFETIMKTILAIMLFGIIYLTGLYISHDTALCDTDYNCETLYPELGEY
jgi:hypothetical protein